MKDNKFSNKAAILVAVLAAVLYALSTPISKRLLTEVAPTMIATFLYLGAGIGVGAMLLCRKLCGITTNEQSLKRGDLPYTIAMIVLDIAAPTFMMFGLRSCTAANTALLNNFEIVATAIIALIFFKEAVSKRLWFAIALMTIASILLSIEQDDIAGAFRFSYGSLLVLVATICWGLENNCTRQIADRDPLEIVTIKGFGSGTGILILALIQGNTFPSVINLLILLLLGFVAYGLSISCYTYAQRTIGAAKTSAYYAVAPFIGAFISICFLGESITPMLLIASIVMAAGCWFAAK